ncbi:O-sialoglycoprotein endopeptidase [Ferrithrix thermotolerans DSM 19514]|uniref:tRNA N6-adenosine threonylcarbamoyltransferase n=1 Tax=Ferrithrix thermotolerans DSM 19514 TaxID=1121881 RepID=A0A1M4SV98_9ACTN|nr:O-sialoglycoprotein endopeptidase [Ferrithrix thermotolerans DSM 19514]
MLKRGRVTAETIVAQNDLHADFGGVVPELASRQHARAITRSISDVLRQSQLSSPAKDLDGVAVTYGPGLAGSLMVGVSAAKALSLAWDVPLVAVDHMEGHLFAGTLMSPVDLPSLTLLVSGGHSQLIEITEPGRYVELGGTLDDAAGEAFDKVARLLGLSFPGGPEIERVALLGDGSYIRFPRALSGDTLDFSFSGLKTAVLRYLEIHGPVNVNDVAAAFQEAVVDALAHKVGMALRKREYRSVVIGGGVAANTLLRSRIEELCAAAGVKAVIPPKRLCTDNGAMIAAAGAFRLGLGQVAALDIGIDTSLSLA